MKVNQSKIFKLYSELCSSNILGPVFDGEITSKMEFKLIGTVNHTGNLNHLIYLLLKQKMSGIFVMIRQC